MFLVASGVAVIIDKKRSGVRFKKSWTDERF